jgi:hypothetical protein
VIIEARAANWSSTTIDKYERLSVFREDVEVEMNPDVERL